MGSILSLVIWLAFAYWGYTIAEKNGRNTTLAAIVCLVFGIFGVIGYYIAGPKK